MRVVVFETEDWERKACLRLSHDHALSCTREPLDARTVEAHADAEVVSPFVNSRLGAEVLERLPRLSLIATRSTGYDHIDLDTCRARGITVCNMPGYGDATVAEHVFALLLGLSHRLVEAVEATRRGGCAPRASTCCRRNRSSGTRPRSSAWTAPRSRSSAASWRATSCSSSPT